MADARAVLEFAKKNGVKMLDLRFVDLPGLWQHVSYPINQLTEDSFEEGFGMDGSSIRGWAAITKATCCSSRCLHPHARRFHRGPDHGHGLRRDRSRH
jgi:glutamine synthetase